MKTKVDIVFNVANYGVDPKVSMRCLLRKKNSVGKKGSISGALIIKPKHEINKYETFQLICANYGLLEELDQAANNPKGGIKLTITGVPAECVHATRQDGTEYDAVIVNFGTETAPHLRAFYLTDIQSILVKEAYKGDVEFTVQESPQFEDDDDDSDLDEDE